MTTTTPYRFPINFDPTICNIDLTTDKGPITVTHGRDEALAIVTAYMDCHWPGLLREPLGSLRYRYVVPGACYDNLWDWDSYFLCCALPDDGLDYAKGTVLNLAAGIRDDGRSSKLATSSGEYTYNLHAYPLLGQFAYIIGARYGDFTWIAPILERLEAAVRWYETDTLSHGKYFTWESFRGNGIDNNPAVYGRPPKSSAGIDLACWHYREYRALAKLSAQLNTDRAAHYTARADALRALLQVDYWDTIDRSFYSIDVQRGAVDGAQQTVTWLTHLKFRNWATLFPLWARVATPAQAAILRDRIMAEAEFLAPCGVRSHSAIEPIYNNLSMANPSNWQGPVWGLSTFVTAYGLANYGYVAEAQEVAYRLIRTYAADITQNGCVHEFYDGDTGQPLTSPNFISWNLLACRIIEDLAAGRDGTSLDLLE